MTDLFSSSRLDIPRILKNMKQAESDYFALARENGLSGKEKIFAAVIFFCAGYVLEGLPMFTWFHELGHVLFAFLSGGGGSIFSPTMAFVTVDNVFVIAGGEFTQILVGVAGFLVIGRYAIIGWPLAGMAVTCFLRAHLLTDFNWNAALVTFYIMTTPVMLFLLGTMIFRFYQYGKQVKAERQEKRKRHKAAMAYLSAGSIPVRCFPASREAGLS